MQVTDVQVRLLARTESEDKLIGFCAVTFDREFVVRDLKVIDGPNGLFVAMPSRKVTRHCAARECRGKNPIRARFCSDCGRRLPSTGRVDGRVRLHVDIAHPINVAARARLHDAVIAAVDRELIRSRQAGYVFARRDDIDDGAQEREEGATD